MKTLEKNVVINDVVVVYQSTINGSESDDLFLTKDECVEFTKSAMAEYAIEGDVEDYIDEIDIDSTEGVRAATDENGKLIIEALSLEGVWTKCE